jgi:hypothetical protein
MELVDVALAALAILAGAIAAVAGFGIGSILTPAVGALIGTKAAVVIVAVPHLVATSLRLWSLRASVDRGVLGTFGIASAAGGLVGALLHAVLPSGAITIVLGVLLVLAGVLELTGASRRARWSSPSAMAAGFASGAFGGVAGNQGGIRAAALLRFDLSARAMVATATATALLVDLVRVPVYLVTNGGALWDASLTVAVLTIGVVIGTVVGTPILRRLPERTFRATLAIGLIVLGMALVAGVGG